MQTEKEYFENYRNLSDQIDALKKQREDLAQEYAMKYCPFKIGDTVKIVGYSHYGKMGIVRRIRAHWNDYKKVIEWGVMGEVLKADGTAGKNYFEFSIGSYLVEKEKQNADN